MRRFFKPDATNENWEYFGKKCPYYGVVKWPQFRPECLDDRAKEEFFQTGETYVDRLVEVILQNVDAEFSPGRVLDFGCGVGRVTIPLAKRYSSVAGIDISPAMRCEAKRNCKEAGLQNVSFFESLDVLINQGSRFDFVHSYIVLQHIRPKRGIPLFAQLVEVIEKNGVGAIHTTFSSPPGKRERLLLWLSRKVPLFHGLTQVIRGERFSEPLMDMAEYPLNKIFAILQDAGCDACCTRFTRHGVRGIVIIFKKKPLPEI